MALAGVLGTIFVHALTLGSKTGPQVRTRAEERKLYREWLTIVALFLAAAAAFYQGYVMSKQADTLNGQLAEMKSASIQTDRIVQSYADFAAAAKASATAEEQSAATARAYLIMNQRANIILELASIKPLQAGHSVNSAITYTNKGRETAPFDGALNLKSWPITEWYNGEAEKYYISPSNKCHEITAIAGTAVAFPDVSYTINSDSVRDALPGNPGFAVDESIIRGDTVIGLFSCIAYRTIEVVHHSAQCYFYRAGVTPTLDKLNICEWGQMSD